MEFVYLDCHKSVFEKLLDECLTGKDRKLLRRKKVSPALFQGRRLDEYVTKTIQTAGSKMYGQLRDRTGKVRPSAVVC